MTGGRRDRADASVTRRDAIAGWAALEGCAALAGRGAACARERARPSDPPRWPWRHMLDLSHTLSPSFPYIPVDHKTFPFRQTPIANDRDGVFAEPGDLPRWETSHEALPSGAAVFLYTGWESRSPNLRAS